MNMCILVFVVIGHIILQLNVVHAHILFFLVSIIFTVNDNTGPINFHAKIGTLPHKYHELDNNDQKATHKVLMMAEMIRPAFPTGFGPLPPLDPYTKNMFQPIAFNAPSMLLRGTVQLKDFTLTGAQHFSLHSVQLRLRNSRTDASISVPELRAEVDFGVHAHFGVLPVVFGGHLSVILTGLSVSCAAGADKNTMSDNQQVFQLVSADVNGHLENAQIKVTNLNLGDRMAEFKNEFSSSHWINRLKDEIALAVVRTAMDEINSILRTLTVDKVLEILLS